jgi:isochorismate synthase
MTVETSLESLVARASARAVANNRPVLASMVERVRSTDPLEALEAVANAARLDPAMAPHTALRAYWARPTDGFALASLGAAAVFAPSGADRFRSIDEAWTQMLSDAVIDDASSGTPGAGPTLIGGFAFDPERPRTDAWNEFPQARLTVPLLQLVARGGDCWLTTSALIEADGKPQVDLATIARLRDAFLAGSDDARESDDAVLDDETIAYTDTRNPSTWRATVRAAIQSIRAGELEKVVLAREVRAEATRDLDVAETLCQLRYAHPTCYVFGFWSGESAFVGATPERLVRVDGHEVQASSLAGSVRRGANPSDDADRAQELFASAKDRLEHEIVRRALCAGLEKLCDDVTAADMPALLSLPQVHHLHTAVHARLRPGHTILQLVAELHPTPAVGGAPRDAALRFIRENEKMDRGWYAGPVGWLQRDHGEFAVALRSALINGSDALLFAGCGVVADSDPDREYAESLLKLRPMQTALAAALASNDFDAEIAEASAFGGDTI